MGYKDEYYEEVDGILNKMKPNPFEDQDPNAVRYEDQGQVQPVGWVENADGTDGEPTVVINADGIAVTDGAITVKDAAGTITLEGGIVKAAGIEAGAITTAKLDATAVIKLVTNTGATVVIDSSGITITGGAITVTNGGGTVIIDGTSNMFKIAATGTMNTGAIATNNSAVSSVTLTALGALAATPALITFIGVSSSSTASRSSNHFFGNNTGAGARRFAALTSGGAVTTAFHAMAEYAWTQIGLDGSNQAVVSIYGTNNSGSTRTYYARYNVMVEAAI